jgi:hypothetical protein
VPPTDLAGYRTGRRDGAGFSKPDAGIFDAGRRQNPYFQDFERLTMATKKQKAARAKFSCQAEAKGSTEIGRGNP